ncbi:AMP-binding protein [Streptomyces massasporeus]|uniref:AMP-binding protein n=1 Tax=Streptomyces massasporeus TaxID=67324 RepID=UPI00331CB2AB
MPRRPASGDGRCPARSPLLRRRTGPLLKDDRAAFVITDAPHLGRLRRLGPPYDGLGALVAGPGPVPDGGRSFHSAVESDEPAEIDTLGLDDPARMLYTSGTTHRPKGVLSAQRAALWSVAACYAPIEGVSADPA